MKFHYDFTAPVPLFFLVLAVLLLGAFVTLLVLAAARRAKDESTFGEPKLVSRLVSHDAGAPRPTAHFFGRPDASITPPTPATGRPRSLRPLFGQTNRAPGRIYSVKG